MWFCCPCWWGSSSTKVYACRPIGARVRVCWCWSLSQWRRWTAGGGFTMLVGRFGLIVVCFAMIGPCWLSMFIFTQPSYAFPQPTAPFPQTALSSFPQFVPSSGHSISIFSAPDFHTPLTYWLDWVFAFNLAFWFPIFYFSVSPDVFC